MGKYRKKPVIVNADIYSLGMEDGFATIGEAITQGLKQNEYRQPECTKFKGIPFITTLEGRHFISKGDYIITGVRGERYPCKPDIFEKTYESVNE